MRSYRYSVRFTGLLVIFSTLLLSDVSAATANNGTLTPSLAPCQVIIGSSYYPSQAAWSPDGSRLAFVIYESGQPQIAIANADGTNLKVLTIYQTVLLTPPPVFSNTLFGTNFYPHSPQWLSDNQQIIFRLTRHDFGEGPGAYIYHYIIVDSKTLVFPLVVDIGSNAQGLGADLASDPNADAMSSLSPDNQTLVYYEPSSRPRELDFIRLSFQKAGSITDNGISTIPVNDNRTKFSWSPDSRYLALADGKLHIIDMSGTPKITDLPLSATGSVVWSPDGSKIAFQNNGIYTTDLNGTNSFQVTSSADNTFTDSNIGWLAYDTKLGFQRQGKLETELYTVDTNGHNLYQVTYGDSPPSLNPVWSPDGQHVLFEFNNTLQLADTNSSCEIATH